MRFQIDSYWSFFGWSMWVFSWEETWISKWLNPLSQSIPMPPSSNPYLLPLSTLPTFLCNRSYLFFSQLKVLLNLLFFWLPDSVLRHSTPCPAHDKNAWECSASHIPPLSEHPVLNAPWKAAFPRPPPTAMTPPWSQGSGDSKGLVAERKQWGGGNLRGPGALPTSCAFFSRLKKR